MWPRLNKKCVQNRRSEQAGFTLLELLLYVTIFSTMIGAVIGLAVLTTSQKAASQVANEVNYQGQASLAYMLETVRRASAVGSPVVGANGSNLSLTMATGSSNPTVFAAVSDGTTNRLRVSEGNPATNNYLTNSRVTVSGLQFSNMSLSGTKGSVLIQFTLTYRTTSNRQELQYSKTFYGGATIP